MQFADINIDFSEDGKNFYQGEYRKMTKDEYDKYTERGWASGRTSASLDIHDSKATSMGVI